MKTSHQLSLIAISTVIALSTMAYSYSQTPNSSINNVIFSPGNTDPITINVGGTPILTLIANANGQASSSQIAAGTYDISMDVPAGFSVVQVGCGIQESNGAFTDIGTWDGANTVAGVPIVAANFQKCTWLLEEDDSLEENLNEIISQTEQITGEISQLQAEITQKEAELVVLESQEASKLSLIQDLRDEINRLKAILDTL